MAANSKIPMFNVFLRVLYLIARNVVIACLTAMVFLVVIDVALRTLTGSGVPGTVEVNEYLLTVAGFLGIFQTYSEKGHVSVGILFNKLPLTVKITLDRINHCMIFVFSLLFMYGGAQRFYSAFQEGETNWFGSYLLPVYFVRLVVPLGCFGICLQSIMNICNPEFVFKVKNSEPKKSEKLHSTI
ncbi:MAG: TRAP transporter small permease [Deltaproteobacteria bacterium]|nr:TRAP transporter small permease [Deltaproteobacteria bacterium]MBW2025914.1 TRAP transporter small permease [Deltaproteobacteria bacterium]MBW2125915.1 TRAP transporter small permease [Deltaproteobacteria bacterium]